MPQKSEIPVLLGALVLTSALVGLGGWLMRDTIWPNPLAGADGSSGRSVMRELPSPNKQKGLNALEERDYATAQKELETSLQINPNDPEARIYLNNAKLGRAKTYTLAVVVPVSKSPDEAKEILRGVAQAQIDINEAASNARDIRLLVIDETYPSNTIAKDLVAYGEVLGVIGHFASEATLAAAPIYQEGRLPMVTPTSNSDTISTLGSYIFRTAPSASVSIMPLVAYIRDQLKVKNVAVFWANRSEASQSVVSAFNQALLSDGGQAIAGINVSAQDFDANQAVQKIQSSNAEAIMMAFPSDMDDVANKIIALNQQALPMVGSAGLYGPDVLKTGGGNPTGLVVSVPWNNQSHANSPFVKKSQALWKGNVSWRTATAYDATKAFATALQNAPKPTRTHLAEALASPTFEAEGATDKVIFEEETGDRKLLSDQLVKVVEGDRAGMDYKFAPMN